MYKIKYFQKIGILLLIFSCTVLSNVNKKEEIINKINKLVKNGSVVLCDENGNFLIDINSSHKYIPASIIKIITSLAAIELLGPDFRFKTLCYFNKDSTLIIKGTGDPFFISDEIRLFAKELKNKGLSSIKKIYLEHSFFSDDIRIEGISNTNNPYDAINGALFVNFNTINVFKDAQGKIYSGEEETPLTPLAIVKASSLPLNKKERFNISSNIAECRRYAGELIITIFKEQGINIIDTLAKDTVLIEERNLFFTYYNSRPLTEILKGLLKYSNNFIANQIFLYLGAHIKGTPATITKSKEVFDEYLQKRYHSIEDDIFLVEGSGISRSNRITSKFMIKVLNEFKPYAFLLSEKNSHLVKSGTLNGVSNYAGYLKTAKGLMPFVIILNQQENHRDEILNLLEKFIR